MPRGCVSILLFSVILVIFLADNVTGNPTDCAGMFSTEILAADSSTLSSTSFSTDLEPYRAIINTSRAWCAEDSDTYQYLQVNLGILRNISSIGLQAYNLGYLAYVTKFTLTYTQDDLTWNYFKDNGNNIKLFINSPVDENEVTRHPLNTLSALRVRVRPQEWQEWICIKIELYTCDPVDGGFSEWSSWGECINSTQTRTRLCNSPSPARAGVDCSGNFSLSQSCILNIADIVDLCTPNPCFHGGQCSQSGLSNANYTCNCTDGFIGYNCSNLVNLCIPNPCHNDSICISVMNSSTIDYTCNCTEGRTGKNCTFLASEKKQYTEYIPSQEMHTFKRVVLPVAAGVGSSVAVTGSVGLVYYIVKSRLAKINPMEL